MYPRNDVTRNSHLDVTMINNLTICTYHGITMHNDLVMNLFYYVLLCIFIILLWVVWNKNTNKFVFDQSGPENTFLVLV